MLKYMEYMKQGIELLQTLSEYLKVRSFLEMAGSIFLTSSVLFIVVQIPLVSSILNGVTEIIKTIAFTLILLSGISCVSTLLMKWLEMKNEARKAEQERLKEEQEMKKKLSRLGVSERAKIKFALSRSGNVWFPADDADVLSLYNCGILEAMTGATIARGKDIFSSKECFAFRVSDSIRDYITENEVMSSSDWLGLPELPEMNMYQE